jgi:ferredoxin
MKKIKLIMYFPPDKIDKPITYHLVKDYDLIFNILNAVIQPNKYGELVAELEGTEENLNKGLEFLKDKGVKYKLFNKNIIWSEEKCVHCGACTAVCPSGALSMDEKTWTLRFDQSKCLICELCIKTCPIKAMDVNLFI